MAPAVTLLMVAHDPGPWFEEALAAVAGQDYPEVEVLVVDVASLAPIEDRVQAVLPEARTVRLNSNRGFGRAVNAVLPTLGDVPFVILAHDDAVPDPSAVRALVEEAFRSNAAVVGPKIVRWDNPNRMLSAGEGADRFGFPVPLVERDELDQEQHDAVRDVFTVPDAFTLVRTDLLRALGGFDPEMSFFGDDLDLCWRSHVAGARVMVAPNARVRHAEALGERHQVDRRRRLQFRHRLRVMLTAYKAPSLLVVIPQLLVVHLIEALFSVLTGRPGQARDVLGSWLWNLRRLRSLIDRRRALKRVRLVRDGEVRALQVRGSARVAAFLRGQLATDQDTFGSAATLSRRVMHSVTGPGRREAAIAWLIVLLILLVGSRHLLTRPIPAIGEFVPFPEHLGTMWSQWWSSWRSGGLGYEGFAPAAHLLVAALGTVFLGAMGLLRTVLILGMFPLAVIGMWRLLAPLASARASAAALVAYAAVPLGYDALATGSWRGLIAYAAAPWVLARVVRSSGAAPFGASDPDDGIADAGPRHDVPPMWRQAVGLGLVVAVAAVLDPLFVLLPLAMVVAMVPGSLLAGYLRGLGRMLVVALGAGVVGAALHAPWLYDQLTINLSWSTFAGASSPDAAGMSLAQVLRFDTGPTGSSILNVALLVAAAFVLLVGRLWRFGWAARAWSLGVGCWALVWASAMGWLPFALPATDAMLAPAAAAMALSVGLGVAAFEVDVRRSAFGWRQLASVIAVVALLLALLPVAATSVGGRWLVPRGSHHQTLAFLDQESDEDPFRVLWLGDSEVLPLVSWPIDGLTSYATTHLGTPTLGDLWPGPAEARSAPLHSALELAVGQRTDRLGRVLAPMGVRYVIVVEYSAPAPYGGLRRPAPPQLRAALAEQLDLVEIDVNPALTVYQNAAWTPIASTYPPATVPSLDGPAAPDGARLAARLDLATLADRLERTGRTSFDGALGGAGQVLVGATPIDGWRVELDGIELQADSAFGWGALFEADEGGTVAVRWNTPLAHQLVLVGQLLLLALIAAVMYVSRAERRIARRHRRAIPSPVDEGRIR
jgi:GT2 family glycosyltransferase